MSPAARKGERLLVGGVPRAELLPPELELEKKARSQRRGLVTVFVLVVLLVGVAYGAVTITAAAMQLALDSETQRTEQLLADQNQYIEVRQLAAQVAASETARQIGTSTEIDWLKFVVQLSQQFVTGTDGVGFTKLQVTSATPIAPFTPSAVPLEQPRVAEVIISGVSPTYGPQADVLKNLEKMPGFADASIDEMNFEDGLYKFTIRLHLNQEVFTNRFASEDDQG